MTRKLTFILSVLLLAALTGCQKADTVKVWLRNEVLGADKGTAIVNVKATGSWTLSLEYGEGSSDWASVDPAAGTGSSYDIRLRCDANPDEEPRFLTLVLKPARGEASRFTVSQKGKPGASIMGTFGYDVAAMDWLELPAMTSADGRELLVHDYNGGKYRGFGASGVRNWSCYWDLDGHLSLWVAYPLNNGLKGTGSRVDGWGALDPCLPEDKQPYLGVTYGGGWTRGHQIPAADRASSHAAAHRSTYYSTNQTPQDYDFNSGVWAQLENSVRNYATQCDTLYVVTGCLFDSSTSLSGSNSGFRVKVPTHYFKALLYYKKNAPDGAATDGYMAAGFLLPHSSSVGSRNCMDYKCSIDQLEKQTGIDFFPNLATVLGKSKADAIEAEDPSSFWK